MELDIEKKIILNKLLRKYDGNNTFILSLQRQLKSTKVSKIEFKGKFIKILTDKQYQAAESILK